MRKSRGEIWMPICQNCKQSWTWLVTIKNMFRLKCPYCGEKQYQSARSKRIASFVNIGFLLIIFSINILLSLTVGIGFILLLIVFIFLFGTMPFYMELANEEEFWW